jgi:hypothetical protein
MTDESSSAVGRAAINAYLDSVELAMIAADAPRIDRLQVIQNLESQIADMLAGQPSPLTEESVRGVLDKLEPPSHFAATYGTGKQSASPTAAAPSRVVRLPRISWPMIAAGSAAILLLGCLFGLLAINSGPNDLLILLMLLCLLVGFVLTPFAIWKAYNQLLAQPGAPGRALVLNSMIVYSVIVPALLMCFITAITEGYALFLLGIAAFFYFQYLLVRRVSRRLDEALPPPAGSTSSRETNGNGAHSPLATETPMPAV